MHEEKSVLVSENTLQNFCRQSLEKSGLSEKDAEFVADTLVKTEMMGVSSHGVVRLPFYCKRLIDRGTKTHPEIKILVEKPAVLLIDGDNGLGQIVSIRAMKKAMEKAKSFGICFAGVKNSCHFGMAAYYAMLALEERMIGMAGTNAPPVMAAWGGYKSVIGANPLAVAVPTAKEYPLVLDISMSVVARGKVALAAVNKEKVPSGWILDSRGRPTDNPEDLLSGGTLLPLGHKGYGLAIIIEILSGVLTGAGILSEMAIWFKETTIPINTGHFFVAMDVKAFCDIGVFEERTNRMINELKNSPLSEGSKGIFMPGEIEFLRLRACKKRGVPISLEVLTNLNVFASEIGIRKLTS